MLTWLPVYRDCLGDLNHMSSFLVQLGDIKDAAIFVSGNEIKWVGSSADIPEEFSKADTVLSLPNRVIIPGMVNTHHHMFQCLTRCVAYVSQ